MAYVELTDLPGKIPQDVLVQALDDDKNGVIDADVWLAVQTAVGKDIDGPLSQRYAVPFIAPIPAIVSQAAVIFALEILYMRRGASKDANPWTKQADDMRTLLGKIASGDEPLQTDITRSRPSASAITEDSKLYSENGNLLI